MFRSCFVIVLLLTGAACFSDAFGQGGMMRRLPRGGGGGGGSNDSVQRRTGHEDSITITFRYLDSSRMKRFDSTITDFSRRFPVPWDHFHLGNVGNATRSMLYPRLRNPGWDHGFHSYDVYNLNDYETRFFNTTRPYTEIQYQLGSRMEQVLGLLHTQNRLPNWNMSFQYRLITSPGFFQNQNTNHNNYRFGSWYQSKNKRYQNFVVFIGNKLISGENGGIRDDEDYLKAVGYEERSAIPTQFGPVSAGSRNFFATDITTGTKYTNATFLMRQQYDLVGTKDSIETDSSVVQLFYPRLRGEHTISYKTYKYRFLDPQPDTAFYQSNYNISDTINYFAQDHWRDITNDFSLYSFPEAKNPQQFLKVGAAFQYLMGSFDTGLVRRDYSNLFLHGEYRNRTRNQKWDIQASGNLYLQGLNAGDYNAQVSLRREISKSIGSLELGFGNVNRTPSFIFNPVSSFYLDTVRDFNKENSTELYAVVDIPRLKMKLTGRYYLISNYTYFSNFKVPEQHATLFNLLQVTAEKQFRLGRNWNWRTWVTVQHATGNPPLNLPLIFTRNQIGYDGKLGFANLLTSFGLEMRYFTPYYADMYSPVTGQFWYQTGRLIELKMPEIGGYLHFRIKTFTAYVRAENLNSLNLSTGSFTNNNVVFPNYPYPGLQIRLGVYWSFVN